MGLGFTGFPARGGAFGIRRLAVSFGLGSLGQLAPSVPIIDGPVCAVIDPETLHARASASAIVARVSPSTMHTGDASDTQHSAKSREVKPGAQLRVVMPSTKKKDG